MEAAHLAVRMAQQAAAIRSLVQGLTDEQAHARPQPDAWSAVEVLCHLLDEEREDFRVRIDYILHRPGETAPEIAPGAWVTERRYNETDLNSALEGFLRQRELSLAWLRSLHAPDWEAAYLKAGGALRAGDLAAAWLAHDILHMRQLVELRWAHLTGELAPYEVRYAGTWQELPVEA